MTDTPEPDTAATPAAAKPAGKKISKKASVVAGIKNDDDPTGLLKLFVSKKA